MQGADTIMRGGYVIGTGWWCSDQPDAVVNPGRKKNLGSDTQREVAFFKVWLENIQRICTPDSIVVVDSASPVKPEPELRAQTSWVELPFNARHATDHIGQWSGWTRSVMMSGYYVLATEAKYLVYVEQDCLVNGKGVIERCIAGMKTGLMFGSGDGTPQPIQQSFFLVRRDRLPAFLKNLADLEQKDAELSPEWKFVYATWRPFIIAANLGLMKRRKWRRFAVWLAQRYFFDTLPVGAGRSRPVPFDQPDYYFQHGTEEEISQHLGVQG